MDELDRLIDQTYDSYTAQAERDPLDDIIDANYDAFAQSQQAPADDGPSILGGLGVSVLKGIGNVADSLGGLIKYGEDAIGLETGVGDAILQDQLTYQIPREQYLAKVDPNSAQGYANAITEGFTQFLPSIASGAGPLGVAAQQGFISLGHEYQRRLREGFTPDQAENAAAASGLINAGLSAPLAQAWQASGPVLRQAVKSGAIGGFGGMLGALGDAFTSKNILDQPKSEEEVLQDMKRGLITGGATGAAFPIANRVMGGGVTDVPPAMSREQMLDAFAPAPEIPGANVEKVPLTAPVDISLPKARPEVDPLKRLSGIKPEAPPLIVPADEFAGGPRSPEQQADMQSFQPYLEQQLSPVKPPPEIAEPLPNPGVKIYRPVTADGAPRAGLKPQEAEIVNYIQGSRDYKAQQARAEEAAGIYDEVLAKRERDRKSSATADSELVIDATSQDKSFPDVPLLQKPERAPEPDNTIQIQPKPGEVIELPYQPTSLISTDTSRIGFARALAQRFASERGAIINPVSEVSEAIKVLKPATPALDNDANYAYKRYMDGPLASYRRTLEWLDTTAKAVPEAAPAIRAVWDMPQNQAAILYDATKTAEKFLTAKDSSAVSDFMYARRAAGARGDDIDIDRTGVKVGLTPEQVEQAKGVDRALDGVLELLRSEAKEDIAHEFYKDSKRKGANLEQLEAQMKKRVAEVDARFDALKGKGYVPQNRKGDFYIEATKPDGDRAWIQVEKQKEVAAVANHYKALGYEVKTGRMKRDLRYRYDGTDPDILSLMNDGATGAPVDGFAGKHLSHAKLVPGFRRDLQEALPEYIQSASRYISMKRMERMFERAEIDHLSDPNFGPVATKLRQWKDALDNPQSQLSKHLGDLFNISYIGGNARTPIGDVLGRVSMQYPMLSRYTGGLLSVNPEKIFLGSIAKEGLFYAGKLKGEVADGLQQFLRKEGISIEQGRFLTKTKNLNKFISRKADGKDKGIKGAGATIYDAYFSLKNFTERGTDIGGFIAGWDAYPYAVKRFKARNEPIPTRQQFAENFVRETKPVPGRMELPPVLTNEAARQVLRYRLFQAKIFKTWFEAIKDGELGQFVRHIIAGVATAGVAGGIPGAKEFLLGARVAGIEPEKEMRELGMSHSLLYGGASDLLHTDFSTSAGVGEILPETGRGFGDGAKKFLLGVLGGPLDDITKAKNFYDRGRYLKAVGSMPLMPQLLKNAISSADMKESGVLSINGQAIVPKEQVTNAMAIKRLIGLTDLSLKDAYVKNNMKVQEAYKARDNEHINQKIGTALGLGRTEEAAAWRKYAKEQGLKVNDQSIQNYKKKARGRDSDINAMLPRDARKEAKRIDELFKQYE